MQPRVITSTAEAGFKPTKQGKVRDIFDCGDKFLIVATDRLSAFDVILPDGIPNKGKVLTQISSFWFRKLSHIVPTHLISTDVREFPEPFRSAPEVFAGRSMLVRKAKTVPVECVVRGYISGSGWIDYGKTQAICGIALPGGLRESDKLPQPIFTPSTKEEVGTHDQNISFEQAAEIVGRSLAGQIRDLSIKIYTEGARYAETRGIIIADTKFEFGTDDSGKLLWIDEALTPDSSRFWPIDQYRPGGPQPSYDKQYVRDFLLEIKWNKTPPAPRLPEKVIATTAQKYEEALVQLTGNRLV